MAVEMGVAFRGRIRLDPEISLSADAGRSFVERTARAETGRASAAAIRTAMEPRPQARLAAPAKHQRRR